MTEVYVSNLYNCINISSPYYLSIDIICSRLNINVHYWKYSSAIAYLEEKYNVFIDNSLNSRGQWQEFGHEMKHYCFDQGSQTNLNDSFKLYQEVKADYFAYHFCVPTFMLRQLKGVTAYDVMNLFNVEFEFALKRIEMYKNYVFNVAEVRSVYK